MASALTRLVQPGGNSLSEDQQKKIRALQEKLGLPTLTITKPIRKIVLAIDATGSMKKVWRAIKNALAVLENRLRELAPGIEITLIAYRDYCDGDRLVQISQPFKTSDDIAAFIHTLRCRGGGDDPEAVEVALEHILRLSPDLAILAGDAPPHGVEDDLVDDKDYRVFARRLGEKKVPVYTLATNDCDTTVQSFGEIATLTGGKMFLLSDLNLCVDAVSAAVAAVAGRTPLLTALMQRENGGELSAGQKRLLLTFSP